MEAYLKTNGFVRVRGVICPKCSGPVIVDVFEWETDSGMPTDGGFHIWCGRGCEWNFNESIEQEKKAMIFFEELTQ